MGILGRCHAVILLLVLIIVLALLLAYNCIGIGNGEIWGGKESRRPEGGHSFDKDVLADAARFKVPINYRKFRTVPKVTRYSSLLPSQYHSFIEAFAEEFEAREMRPRTFLDATAHVGVETVALAKAFKLKGKAIELEPDRVKLLRRNLKAHGLEKRIEAVEGDGAEAVTDPVDLLYIDPPWGGPSYKKRDSVELTLGGHSLEYLVRGALAAGTKLVVVKSPLHNYDDEELRRAVGRPYRGEYSRRVVHKEGDAGKPSFALHFLS